MSQTSSSLNLALCKQLIERRNQKSASWKTFVDSNNITRCALSEMPVDECLYVDRGCCNCRKYKPAEFVIIDSKKVDYHTIEKYLSDVPI